MLGERAAATTQKVARSAWFPYGTSPRAPVRLLCLPHAGAGATVYRNWASGLPDWVGVCPMQPPGRERRRAEPPATQVRPLVAAAADEVVASVRAPYAIFGHSTGALCAFELAREMRRRGAPEPAYLFVSGRPAPQDPMRQTRLGELSIEALADVLRRLGGTPEEVLSDRDFLAMIQPMLVADFTVNEEYAYYPEPPLDVPLMAFPATGDPDGTAEAMAPWREATAAGFSARELDGGHFAIFDQAATVLGHIAGALAPWGPEAVPAASFPGPAPEAGLSAIGRKMASMSGLRSIMEDIATSTAESEPAGWLNLSIGNPAAIPEVSAAWQGLAEEALRHDFAGTAGAYGPSRGSHELVGAVADYFGQRYGWDLGPDRIVVGPGSQMLCFAAAAMFAGPGHPNGGRVVLPVQPDYVGYQGMCMAEGGVAGVASPTRVTGPRRFAYDLDLPALADRDDIGLMVLSSPGNPTGRAVSEEELRGLIAIAERAGAVLVVDHAYGAPFPKVAETLVTPVEHPHVINTFSLSKAGLPGERVGFAIGSPRYITPIVSFLSNSLLHAPRLAQAVAARGLSSGVLDQVVATAITPFYARRRQLAEDLLAASMPPGVRWRTHHTRGGMFCWAWIDEDWFDDLELYQLAKARHVFITPGRGFFTDTGEAGSHARQCIRISLTTDGETLAEGIKRIAGIVATLRQRRQV
jgi:valine--pyruvate aminotransferase